MKPLLCLAAVALFQTMGCTAIGVPDQATAPGGERGPGIQEAAFYFQQGVGLVDRGEHDKAILAFQQALTINPQLAVAHNNLGILFKQKGMIEQAQEQYLKAITLAPTAAEFHNNLGILLRETGRFQEAEKEYRQAIRADENFASAHFNLGILYDLYLNRPEEAIKAYAQYAKLDGRRRSEIELWIQGLEKRLGGRSEEGGGLSDAAGEPKMEGQDAQGIKKERAE